MINKLLPLLLFVLMLTSCDDEVLYKSGEITFEKTGLYFNETNEGSYTQTTTFKLKNVATLSITDITDGWDVEYDFFKSTVTVTRPSEITEDEDGESNQFGEVSFNGETPDGYSCSATLDLGIVPFIDLGDVQANSMIVTQPSTFYHFDPSYKGEKSMNERITDIYDCKLMWRSYPTSIRHVQMMDNGDVGFYLIPDQYDFDSDGDKTDIEPGNAVVAVRNSSHTVLWSWHIWITEDDPEEISFNGKTFMSRNIGAHMNEIDTLYSHGLYYQWGRKDPFIGSSDYVSTWGYSAVMVDDSSDYIPIEYEDPTSTIGTVAYSIKYPVTYILGIEESEDDWLYKNHDSELWNDNEKSLYDPSPIGWRVPRSTDFDGIEIASYPTSTLYEYGYGAYLKDPYGNEELFMGLGRRNYITGRLQNTNLSPAYTPWSGYYWTSGGTPEDIKSKCLVFSNYNDYLDSDYHTRRANALQIRCVKDE